MDPTDAAHVLSTPEEYGDFLADLPFAKRIEMVNAFRCAELQGAEELRVLADCVDDPDLVAKFSRHAADEEKHGAYFAQIMRWLGVEPFEPSAEPDHITIGGRLIVDTLNDIEEILPRRGEIVGLERVIPVLVLFQAVESRALVSFEAHRRSFEAADPRIADLLGQIIADESHHAAYVRTLLDRWAENGYGDVVREAEEATREREASAREWAAERLEAERLRDRGDLPGVSEADRERRERVRAALAAAAPDGVSGPDLAALLGCSRAAVHRHVDALRRAGLDVEAGPRGYRLAGAPDLVVPALVAPRLVPPLAGPLVWLAETGSTNDEAVRRARAGAPEGLVVGAEHQTAGRGRRGRAWVARAGDALLVSVLLRPPVAPVDAGLLPIVVAVATADAVAAGRGGVSIAWPNDVMVAGRKVAGILCELSGDQDRVAWAVAGIGVNVRAAPSVPDARWPPGALADSGAPPSRADLLVALLGALGARYEAWLERGPDELLGAFAARDGLLGREVRLSVGDETVTGQARGIDELGRLRLNTAGGTRLMAAGEVTGVDA